MAKCGKCNGTGTVTKWRGKRKEESTCPVCGGTGEN